MDLRNIRTNLKFELDEENIINNVTVVEDVISKAQEAFSVDLTKDLGNISSTIESLSASTGLSLGSYVDPSRLLVPETEELPFKNDKDKFDMEFERLYSNLATANTIIKKLWCC